MKRSMTERDQMENLTMANCLMFLSRGDHHHQLEYSPSSSTVTSSSPGRVFECKTCNRQFPSFQALGGHRASHKKPRVMTGDGGSSDSQSSPAKPKTHECTICGLEFAIGQALGGHMRRHRTTMSSSATHDHHNQPQYHHQYPLIMTNNNNNNPSASQVPGLKKSARILSLDLNLTPLENDIKILQLGKTVQLVDCFL